MFRQKTTRLTSFDEQRQFDDGDLLEDKNYQIKNYV